MYVRSICQLLRFFFFLWFKPETSMSLRDAWLCAPAGRLCAWQQARALALREVSKEFHAGRAQLEWVAERVEKVGGGSPGKAALSKFFALVDADPDWFPGKKGGEKPGRKPVLTRAKRRCIALSAMSSKKQRGDEPCVAAVVHACPRATLNPSTRQPFCDRTIRKVFLEDCYDSSPDFPWRFQCPLQKVFLSAPVKEQRLAMSQGLLRSHPSSAWWAQHVVWFDPCSTILPGSQKQYDQMRQVCKGKKRYISDDSKLYSPNLSGPPTALKQRGWEGKKVNWFMVLARGVVHVEVMPETWTLDGDGLAAFVARLPNILRRMFGPSAHLPRVVFTDRGTGMYNPAGKIVWKYSEALAAAGFRSFWGDDASVQAPDMGDMLLHETAVAWLRQGLKAEKPCVPPWEETQLLWAQRARQVVRRINANFDVKGLCSAFPQRLSDVVSGSGERLRK